MGTVVDVYNKFFGSREKSTQIEEKSQKFGVFAGVFVPCLLMLFGVIIFLRLGWIVGQVGLATSIFIITLAAIVTFISTLSMAAISTNITIGKGGVYYIISRSLGIEIGSAVGLPLYLKQVLSIAFCCIGFAESLHDLIPAWSITNIGLCTLCVLTFLAYTSVKGALKVQIFIFVILLFSFISLFTGGDVLPMHPDTFTPASSRLGFWTIFAIFFPAMTGVESIVSLSGDLKNPSKSIPIGTIAASIVSYLIYISIAIFLAFHVPLDRLANDPLILQDVASIPSLIILGIWGATLSSALGGLLSAPRTLQAMSDDGILPKFLGKCYGSTNEPRIATLGTFAIVFSSIYLGSINVIAPVMTMISLVCYGVLNFSSGFETMMSNPSWRPRFRVHWLISILGALLCIITMLMIDAGIALISLLGVFGLYLMVKKKKFQGSWADIRQGILLFVSRFVIYELAYGPSFSKSWRPHFLVFTKSTEEHSTRLLTFTEAISQSKSFLTLASFIPESKITDDKREQLSQFMSKRFKAKRIRTFVNITEGDKASLEMQQMLKYYGLGPLKPNTVILGGNRSKEEAHGYAKTIRYALERSYNVLIVNNEKDDLTLGQEKKDIHVWFDDQEEDSSELMLVFAYMMQRNPSRKKCRICVKSIVKDERAREGKIKFFQELSIKLRLPINIDVYVAAEPEQIFLQFTRTFSVDAELVFLPLKKAENDLIEDVSYSTYLEGMSKFIHENPRMVLVASSDHTPLDSILT